MGNVQFPELVFMQQAVLSIPLFIFCGLLSFPGGWHRCVLRTAAETCGRGGERGNRASAVG